MFQCGENKRAITTPFKIAVHRHVTNLSAVFIQAVQALRRDGVPAFLTIDAGPQVKVVCLPGDEARVIDALSGTDGVESVLASGIGARATLVNGD